MPWTFFHVTNNFRHRQGGVFHDKHDATVTRDEVESNGNRCTSIFYCSRNDHRITVNGRVSEDGYLGEDQ